MDGKFFATIEKWCFSCWWCLRTIVKEMGGTQSSSFTIVSGLSSLELTRF